MTPKNKKRLSREDLIKKLMKHSQKMDTLINRYLNSKMSVQAYTRAWNRITDEEERIAHVLANLPK